MPSRPTRYSAQARLISPSSRLTKLQNSIRQHDDRGIDAGRQDLLAAHIAQVVLFDLKTQPADGCDIDQADFFAMLRRTAKSRDGNGDVGTSLFKGAVGHRPRDFRVDAIISLRINPLDPKHVALGVERIYDITALQTGTQFNVAGKERRELSSGTALRRSYEQLTAFERGFQSSKPLYGLRAPRIHDCPNR